MSEMRVLIEGIRHQATPPRLRLLRRCLQQLLSHRRHLLTIVPRFLPRLDEGRPDRFFVLRPVRKPEWSRILESHFDPAPQPPENLHGAVCVESRFGEGEVAVAREGSTTEATQPVHAQVVP